MGRRYHVRVSGKARENPDPVMLAQIVILIGRRLHAEQLQQQRNTSHGSGDGADTEGQEHGDAAAFEPPVVSDDE